MKDEELAQLRRDIQVLKDIEAVRCVKHAYFRYMDTGQVKEIGSLLHDDVEVLLTGGTYQWALTGKKAYLEALAQSVNPRIVVHHHGHTPEIQILSETEAVGIWYLNDSYWNIPDALHTTGTALYRDRYVKQDGRWLIRRTTYRRIYEIVEPLPKEKVPNFTYRWLADPDARLPE